MLGSVTADCPLQSHLGISSRSLPSLIASAPSTRALVSRVPSLTILYQWGEGRAAHAAPGEAAQSDWAAGHGLLPVLLSVALRVVFDMPYPGEPCPPPLAQLLLLSLMQVLAAGPTSCSSLRELVIEYLCNPVREEERSSCPSYR
jgi:hypothetical protein